MTASWNSVELNLVARFSKSDRRFSTPLILITSVLLATLACARSLENVHKSNIADINFEVDIDRRRARLVVPGYIESRGEPILNPVSKAEHRARIDSPNGFKFRLAEIGRGWSKSRKSMNVDLADSYGQFWQPNLF